MHLDLAIQALDVLARSCFSGPCARMASSRGRRCLEALPRDIFEVGVGGVLGRDVEVRERILDLFELDVAALRDIPGARSRASSGTSPNSSIISSRDFR